MTLGRRIGRNALAKLAGEAASRGGGFLFYFLLARWLGAESFGRYSLAVSFATLFAVAVDLGTNVIVTREIARRPDGVRDLVSRLNGLKLASTALYFAVLLAAMPFAPGGSATAGLVLAAGVLVAASMVLESLHSVMSGLERMEVESLSKAINKIGLLAGAAVGFAATRTLGGTVAGLVTGAGASLAISYLLLMRLGAPAAVRWDGAWNRGLLAHSLPLVVSWVFWNFYDNQDVVLLGYLGLPAAAVGHFAAAMKLVDTLRGVPVLITGALFPVLSAGAVEDRARFAPLAALLVRAVFSAAVPIAVASSMLAAGIVRVIFGAGFEPAAGALRVAAWAIVGIFVNHVMIHVLVALDLQRRTIAGAVGATIVNLAALLLLAPRYGLPGAAASLILSEAAFLAINLRAAEAALPGFWKSVAMAAVRPAVAGAFMAASLAWVLGAWHPVAAGLAGLAIYAVALVLLGGVPKELRGRAAS